MAIFDSLCRCFLCHLCICAVSVHCVICPKDWTLSTAQSKCYRFFSEERTWRSARAKCRRSFLGELVVVKNEATHNELNTIVRASDGLNYWHGLNDIKSESNFVWSETQNKATFRKFKDGQPDDLNGDQNCVQAESLNQSSSFYWYDENCDAKFPFLCESEPMPDPTKVPERFASDFFLNPHERLFVIVLMVTIVISLVVGSNAICAPLKIATQEEEKEAYRKRLEAQQAKPKTQI